MSRSSSRRRHRSLGRDQSEEESLRPRNKWLFGLVIGLAVLAGLAIPLSSPPQDRVPLILFEVVIVGLAFILYGAMTAVEKEVNAVEDILYCQRPGWIFRRPLVPRGVFDALYLTAFVLGVPRAVIQPRQTWPAVLWIAAGCTVIGIGVGLLVLLES